MRPRVFPAEDQSGCCWISARASSFNEAAGIPRGRPPRRVGYALRDAGFNEAAGIPRGRHEPDHARDWRDWRFNEAAGIPRGRQSWQLLFQRGQDASMRPRVFPAEDTARLTQGVLRSIASMRPRVFPAEDVRRSRSALVSPVLLQ